MAADAGQVSPPGWTNASVLRFAGDQDPIDAASAAARRLLAAGAAAGIQGPPVDVIALAEHVGLKLRPQNDVSDARIVAAPEPQAAEGSEWPARGRALTIEFNPSRPRGRLRFSVAHELAHACFDDVSSEVRHRTGDGAIEAKSPGDNWELELLCNVIAAELLLPDAAIEGLLNVETDIDFIMDVRRRWDVSTEAIVRRLVSASPRPMAMLALSRLGSSRSLRVDYVTLSDCVTDDSALQQLQHGAVLDESVGIVECSAVGATSRGSVAIAGNIYPAQAVGIPPYPGSQRPRIVAIVEVTGAPTQDLGIQYVTGDLLNSVGGEGTAVLAHVTSDAARAWSRFGVARAISRRFPNVASAYRSWTISNDENLRLGNVHAVDQYVDGQKVIVASLVAQHGYGRGEPVRLHYDALDRCLEQLAQLALGAQATVHVPRLGAGQAGGRWDLIEAALSRSLTSRGVPVVVHTLPSAPAPRSGR